MTFLHVMSDRDRNQVSLSTRDRDAIVGHLAAHGFSLTGWDTVPLSAEPSPDEVLSAYREPSRSLAEEAGYQVVDAVSLRPGRTAAAREKAAAARGKFLDEHSHDEDEVRFFAHGRGCFYLHVGEHVHAVVCEPGDLLAVPSGTKHWFDMGSIPDFTAIRFFRTADGWVGDFTGDRISARMPTLDELAGLP